MKKIRIIAVIIMSVVFFSLLVLYGLKYSRGVPVVSEETKRPRLSVPFLDKDIDFNQGIDLPFWDTRPSEKIDLLYQLMVLPWPKATVPYIKVKAFHNREDIYFYLEWPDDTEDSLAGINSFSDATAIMFPLDKGKQTSTLMMGFLGKANIWHWKAQQNNEYWLKEISQPEVYVDFYYPFEEEELFIVSKEKLNSAVKDLIAIRVGTITPKSKQAVEGRGIYKEGMWKVVFRRALRVYDSELDADFSQEKSLCAFAAWNGSKGDRGGRKSISDWVELTIK